MAKRQTTGPTAERFIDETIALIAETGGAKGVNLREISRRIGCAHTNVYNYFASLDELLWVAFHDTVWLYGAHLGTGLDASLGPRDYFRRLVTNLATFPQENPGLYRFIGSDPIDIDAIPSDVLESVAILKGWLVDVFKALASSVMSEAEAEELCNITYGYIDGETLNLINGRVVPGEEIGERIVSNAMRLFDTFVGEHVAAPASYPELPRRTTKEPSAQNA